MHSWGLLTVGIAALGFAAFIITIRLKPRTLRTRVDFRSYKAKELQRRGNYLRNK